MKITQPNAIQTCDFATRYELIKNIAVGKTVLVFDDCRRIYKEPEAGRLWAGSGPIYRGHFRAVKIEGETSRSWILRDGEKIPKKTLKGVYSNRCADQSDWLRSYGYKIGSALQNAASIETIGLLVRVSKELGLDIPEPPGLDAAARGARYMEQSKRAAEGG